MISPIVISFRKRKILFNKDTKTKKGWWKRKKEEKKTKLRESSAI